MIYIYIYIYRYTGLTLELKQLLFGFQTLLSEMSHGQYSGFPTQPVLKDLPLLPSLEHDLSHCFNSRLAQVALIALITLIALMFICILMITLITLIAPPRPVHNHEH